MAKARLLGFTAGVPVSLSVSDSNGGSGSISIAEWGIPSSSGDQTVTIQATRTSDRIAPDPVVFKATPADFTLPSLPIGATKWRPAEHRLLYKWTFTASGRTWSYFRSPFSEWDEHDVRYGPKVTQMIFDPSSDFTATVEVWGPGGEYATASTTILAADIVDPDVFYAGAQTVIVDPSGVGDPSRPGAVIVTSVNNAFTISNRNKRILIRRGETYTASWNNYNTNGSSRFYVGTWGTGARPIINWTGKDRMFLLHENSIEPPRMMDLDLRGPGDLTADLTTASPTEPGFLVWIQSRTPVIIVGCSMSQNARVANFSTNANTHMVFWDCKITKWWDYGMLLGQADARLSIVGTDISQDPDMDSGGQKFKSPNVYANHGPVRLSAFEEVYMDCVSMASHNGWFPAGGYTDIQPTLRLTELASGASVYVSRFFSEGIIQAANTNGNTQNLPLNCVLDKFVVLLTSAEGNGGHAVALERGGITTRNGLVISDNIKNWHFQDGNNQYAPMVVIRNQAIFAETSQVEPIEVYGLTLVDRLSSANNTDVIATISDEQEFDNVIVSGVITHAPAKDIPSVPFAPMVEGANLRAQALWKGFAYRPGALRTSLVNSIDASQTTEITIDDDRILDRFAVEGAPLTFILGGSEIGEQITATGAIFVATKQYELTGVTRGVNGTSATNHSAGSEQVWNAPIARQTPYAATPNFAKTWTPAVGSAALGGASADDLKPLDDILGKLRTSVKDVDEGAFQVSS